MIKRFIIKGFSKKFKGTQKIPAQKTPSRFSAMYSQATAEAKARKVFGELPEFMGLSQKATSDLAAESLALQTANKKFFRTLPKELKRSRLRTATGVKSIRQTKKVPKLAVFKAKQKGAMKAYGIATQKSEKAFMGTMETFTTRQKSSPFKMRSKETKRPLSGFEGEKAQYVQSMRNMGFDVNKSKSLDIDAFDDTFGIKKIRIRKQKK